MMECQLHVLLAVSLLVLPTSLSSGQVVAPNPLGEDYPLAVTADIPNAPAKPPAPREIDGEPLLRGPVHEAFAEPLFLTPKPDKIVPRKPPAPITEIAPQTSDDVQNMEWISGYWAWDEQRQGFVWVSGVWRRVPKGRGWQKGYWREADGGYQWVPGAWLKLGGGGVDEGARQEVLPIPPDSLEEGPTSPAPSQNHFWVPGVWQRTDDRYAWRPGFWTAAYENWVWNPEHYAWTPDGCILVPGYWDYPWERRGMLYAPCTFAAADQIGNVFFRPTNIIDTNQWLSNLWVRPGCGHYFYGDYFDYTHLGYAPWYSHYHDHPQSFDPLYTHYRWAFTLGFGRSLYSHLHGLHRSYSEHAHLRPTVTHYDHENRRQHDGKRGYATAFGRQRDHGYRSDRNRISNRDGNRRHVTADTRDLVQQRRRNLNNENQRSPRARSSTNSRSNNRLGASRETNHRLDTRPRFRNQRGTNSLNGKQLASGSPFATGSPLNNRRRGGSPTNRQSAANNRSGLDSQAKRGPGSDVGSSTKARTARQTIHRLRATLDRKTRHDPSAVNVVVQRKQESRSPSVATINRSTNPIRSVNPRPSSARSTARSSTSRSRSRPNFAHSMSRPAATTTSRPRSSVSRSSVSRSSVSRSSPRPASTTSRPRPSVSRPTARPSARQSRPTVTRKTPSASRRSSGRSSFGFSTTGLKRARGADLHRQRAAMNKRMAERKRAR